LEKGILIAGSGGQGILLLGRLIAHTAMIEGKHVTWFPSYGAEMRGGTANCTVVVSDEPIGSPIIRNPDTLIVFNCPSFYRFFNQLKDEGHLYYDSSQISKEKCTKINLSEGLSRVNSFSVSALEEAEKLGSTKFANMVMFGMFLKKTFLYDLSKIGELLSVILPVRHHSLIPKNIQAIERGYYAVEN
jgi:2-oxoglutarate ferredoxin oxidoreductase subunit gamma